LKRFSEALRRLLDTRTSCDPSPRANTHEVTPSLCKIGWFRALDRSPGFNPKPDHLWPGEVKNYYGTHAISFVSPSPTHQENSMLSNFIAFNLRTVRALQVAHGTCRLLECHIANPGFWGALEFQLVFPESLEVGGPIGNSQ